VIENKGPAQALVVTSLGAIQANEMTEWANSINQAALRRASAGRRSAADVVTGFRQGTASAVPIDARDSGISTPEVATSNRNIPLLEALLTLAKPMTSKSLIATRTPIRPAQGAFTP
jgi:hypothetical protein